MSSTRPPRLADNVRAPKVAVWLLKHFRAGPSNEAALGDILELVQQGQPRWWLWKQVASVLLLALRGFFVGILAGALVGFASVIGNIRKNDPHLISFFPDAISPILLVITVCLAVRHWHRSGILSDIIRRNLWKFAAGAALVSALSHYALSLWWFRNNLPIPVLWIAAQHIATIGFFLVFLIVMVAGRVALRLNRHKESRSRD